MNKTFRIPLVIGNWKLNNTKKTSHKLVVGILQYLSNINRNCDVVIAPPMIYLDYVNQIISNSNLILGAQNVDVHTTGPFTGDISIDMLKDVGVKYIIIGHSERRDFHKENNQCIIKKFNLIKNKGLIPVLCVGEKDKHDKKTFIHQIDIILKELGVTAFQNAVIAYEPIYAIGTGKAALPTEVQKAHKLIREHIANQNINIAKQVIIQYGGSVNETNAFELFSQPDVDGLLLGGSSLNIKSFIKIIKIVSSIEKTFTFT